MRSCHTWLFGVLAACTIVQAASAQLPAPAGYPYGAPVPYGPGMMGAAPAGAIPAAMPVPPGMTFQPGMGVQHAAVTGPDEGPMVVPAGHFARGRGCDARGCDSACDSSCDGRCGGGCDSCCSSGAGYMHAFHFYGEFLYLRARDAEVAWATPANSNFPVPPNTPVQIGPIAVLDPDFDPGFRFGFQYNLSECTGISAQYTMYEGNRDDSLAITGNNLVQSMVSHPAIDTTAQNFRQGEANYNINYDLLDIDYHQLLWYDSGYQFGYLAGLGVVQMEQTFDATFAGTGTESVSTDIDFYGAGSRFGLEGEGGNGRVRFYGKGIANLIAGEFRADYDLAHSFDPVVVDTAWRGGRVIGIWELETGFKWVSRCNNYSANVGYVYTAWSNVVQTDQWIQGVQRNSFTDLDDTMTFDGLVLRVEARY